MKAKEFLSHFPKTVEWSLVAKIAIATATAVYTHIHAGVFAWVVSAIVFWILFSRETPERITYRRSYLVLTLLLFAWGTHIDVSWYSTMVVGLVYAVLFFIWLGMVRFLFKKKERIRISFHIALSYIAFLFAMASSGIISALFTSALVVLLLREECAEMHIPWGRRITLITTATGLLLFELILIIRIFPLGYIMGAGFLSLIALCVRDCIIAHFLGKLTPRYLLERSVLFIVISILIFLTATWVF